MESPLSFCPEFHYTRRSIAGFRPVHSWPLLDDIPALGVLILKQKEITMSITPEKKQEIIKEFGQAAGDTGSPKCKLRSCRTALPT